MPDFEAIYRERFPEVYWTAYAILHNRDRAQDAAQTVFLRALRHERTLLRLEEGQLRLWLYRAARNACIDELRRIRRERVGEEATVDLPDPAPLPEEAVESKALQARVFAQVEALPEKYRRPILLYYFAGMPQGDIAAALGVGESTLRSQLRRGKALLYAALQEGGGLDG